MYVYGPALPFPAIVAAPLDPPKHETLELLNTDNEIGGHDVLPGKMQQLPPAEISNV